jgi:ppGpp synthetase/RelA/SpoT-type nucleotidyltranferase
VNFNLDELSSSFRADADRYRRLCHWVESRIRDDLSVTTVYSPVVEARPKDLASYLKKALRKGYENPEVEIKDRAGARVIIPISEDRETVERVIADRFHVLERIDKAAELGDDQLGYLGIHFLVTPKSEDLSAEVDDLAGLVCEIQIHTIVEHAWAAVSHRLLYKPAGGGPSRTVSRRINRLVALVELFDQEVASAWETIVREPGYMQGAMLVPLEAEFLEMSSESFDEALSLEVLGVVAEAYSADELGRFGDLISEFVRSRRQYISAVLENSPRESSNPLLHQPEALAILERLERKKERLRAVWDAKLPAQLLTTLSEELGRPV